MSFIKKIGLVCFIVFCCAGCRSAGEKLVESAAAPRIINIINFIRQTDYRVENADSLLYETVCEQVKLVNKYDLPATFLLQYDALINPLYQDLLKSKLNAHSEIGAWWELTQPQIEAAGIKWRGEHSWVSHANIAFSTGYTKEERERLVDVYMAKFKEIFGTYPKSVGSWFIDAHTLGYMYDKYKIVASCNCKDQVGTDGYTLWGGYWNQAYYPSRVNAYMPALPMLRGNENAALVEQVLAKLEAKNPDYAPLKKYKADMAEAKAQKERLAEGKVAPEFSYPTPDGNKNLGPQDFKGKILVLDFWASWCGPCRQEIPHLKEAFEAYNEKGVEFLSVSIDKDGNAWRKAMKDENMPWAQVQAPKAGKDVMKLYQFSGIPYILVLDQEGRIVGKNLRGQKLMDKLEEMVNGGAKKSVAMPAMGM